ncbi:MAG: fatty acid--CoA ligase [Pseudomonadota bacterium]
MSGSIQPVRSTVLADIVRHHAEIRPNKVAFIFEDRELLYGALNKRASQVANGLLHLGVNPSERIAFLGKNSPDYFEILMGVSKSGAVMAPVNWRLAPAEIEYILNDMQAQIIFVDEEFHPLVAQLRATLPMLKYVFMLSADPDVADNYVKWRDAQNAHDVQIARNFEDDALHLYTSGTTGHPKGAVLSNRAVISLREVIPASAKPEWNVWREEDVSLVAMPCFHIGGTGWGLNGLTEGSTGIVMREFDPYQVLDLIQKFKISKIFMVPAAMKIVVDLPDARSTDFSSIKYMLYGASPIPLDLLKRCMDVFQCQFVQMYGMTETAGTIIALPPGDHDPDGNEKMLSAGQVLAGAEVAILDELGCPVPAETVGEIAIRSVSNMTGYWRRPEETAKTIDEDGWLRTGDAGCMDKDGYVFIRDRVKDMIISGGENIYPAEVENAIFGHPKVSDVAVIGVPDKKWGEAVKAIVVPNAGETIEASEIIDWARQRIAGYKCPKSVDLVSTLPRNASGKILKKVLRAPFWENAERSIN